MATLKDIAEEVGISVSTVSLALRDHRSISIETKQRIWEAQEKLGYRLPIQRPSSLARKGKPQGTGVVFRDIAFLLVNRQFDAPAYVSIVQSLSDRAASRHWRILYATAGLKDLEEGKMPVLLKSSKPDGIVVSGVYSDRAHHELRKLGIPIVVHGRYHLGEEPWMSCEPDFAQAISLFLHRMMELGHRRFGLYVKDTDSEFVKNLIRYYLRGIEEKGVEFMGVATLPASDEGMPIEALIAKRPTALLVAPGSLVPHLYQICERSGLSIPRDISILLFHHSNDLLLNPTVAGLAQCGMTDAIIRKLEQLMADPNTLCTRELFPKKLVPGGSIGKAPEIRD